MAQKGLTLISATIVMISSMLGCGVIFLPLSFKTLGYFKGVAALLLISSFSFSTLYFISYAAHNYLKTKKEEVSEGKASPSALRISYYIVSKYHSSIIAPLVDVCLVAQGLGSCISYLLALKDWLQLLFNFGQSKIASLVFIMPLYGLSMMKNLSSLKYASYLSVFSVVYLMGLLSFYSFYFKFRLDSNVLEELRSKQTELASDKIQEPHKAIGTIIFALGCHQNIVQVFSELKDKRIKQITMVSLFSIIGGSLIYSVIGLAGYFVGGDEITGEILKIFINDKGAVYSFYKENFKGFGGYLTQAGVYLFLLVIICAFPMQMHPARDSFVNIISIINKGRQFDERNVQIMKYIVTTVFCSAICGASMVSGLKPDKVVSFIGATATNGITYIFPSLLFMMTIGKINIKSVSGGVVAGLGTLSMAYMVYKELTEGKN